MFKGLSRKIGKFLENGAVARPSIFTILESQYPSIDVSERQIDFIDQRVLKKKIMESALRKFLAQNPRL